MIVIVQRRNYDYDSTIIVQRFNYDYDNTVIVYDR